MNAERKLLVFAAGALWLGWCTGMLGRGYWTPDEPREADLSWRMSWQADRAVPLLAGEAFCEKPPLTYWLAGASIRAFGAAGWAARLPNLAYALITAWSVGWLAWRSMGKAAGVAAAAAISTFLLSYQVAIWLATDAPLQAAVAAALVGVYLGFYAATRRARLMGYGLMHAALALGFLAKSAAAWMTPALALATLIVVERRWRELLRLELWLPFGLQLLAIGAWTWFVIAGPDGAAHLKVFFVNNLLGRFTRIEAPAELQYALAHRNTPGKYLLELPIYLFPWTLLVAAAARRAWLARQRDPEGWRPLRFAFAASLPTLAVLSVAATARNVYLAPALPGAALLLAWWVREVLVRHDRADVIALGTTAGLLLFAIAAAAAVVLVMAANAGADGGFSPAWLALLGAGTLLAAVPAALAWRAAWHGDVGRALPLCLAAYCALLALPAWPGYVLADRWQDLGAIGRSVRGDLGAAPLVLIAPDETTRAWVDLYVSPQVVRVPGPLDERAFARLADVVNRAPRARVLVQLEGRAWSPEVLHWAERWGFSGKRLSLPRDPRWADGAHFRILKRYTLPNGRGYALLEPLTSAP